MAANEQASPGPSAPAVPTPHRYRMPDSHEFASTETPDPREHRQRIEPWLAAMFQAEHLALLVGNGLTMGGAFALGARPVSMASVNFTAGLDTMINRAASESARRIGRGNGNLEDQLRAATALSAGLEIQGDSTRKAEVDKAIENALGTLLSDVLDTERMIAEQLDAIDSGLAGAKQDLVGPFLLSFASRSSSRERLNLFTTNYDRLLEFSSDRLGLRLLDRFVGTLSPVFRSSRLEVDIHYNPPGIRGEPRYLEGVVKMCKLHGSIDWRFTGRRVRRVPLPFGAPSTHPEVSEGGQRGVIYPMAAKDVETSAFPYSELFRDFSAAICRPNTVLVTYGYGFGDSHINTAITDMLTIPSAHLVIISFDEADGRIQRFISTAARDHQVSYMIGSHFGSLLPLVEHYLPRSSIDHLSIRKASLLSDRGDGHTSQSPEAGSTGSRP